MDISFLQKNYLLVFVAILLSLGLTAILNLVLTQNNQEKSYIKTAAVAGIITGIVIWIHNMESPIEPISLDPAPF
jgi:uncharacterized protein YacL